ncbi:MAG: alpha/beta hydrolase [Bacteroidales bacterium]|nr:alpha/beta hydrolase [Candidatus Sodaliphilus aphodohippi]
MNRVKCIFVAIILLLGNAVADANGTVLGSWTGKLAVGTNSLTIVLNFAHDNDGKLVCTLDSPDQGARNIPAVPDIKGDSVTVTIQMLGAAYSGLLQGDVIDGIFTQFGNSFPLKFSRGTEKLNRPQMEALVNDLPTSDVTFANSADGVTLAGTITYPIGYEKIKDGKLPVVLMITGSGQQNRDEEILGHKLFLVIADYLARNGIATLRYDDRGVGQSRGGDVRNATTLDFVRDAKAGVELLRADKRFGKVGVLGHSEGANIAMMLGAKGVVDFVVGLAGIGVKGDEALTAQVNMMYKINGSNQTVTVEQYRKNVEKSAQPWIRWFIDYDPTPDIKAIRCPVMALNGDKDCQVISALNLTAIKQKLPRNRKNLVKEYEGLNHLFQHCTTGAFEEYRTIGETFSPEVLADITKWIKSLH